MIDTDRHSVKIEELILRPGNSVRAGSALFAVVRVENQGKKEEQDVRVEVSIPELGVSDTAYIDEIDEEEQEETQELYLPIPRDADEGTYEVEATVVFDNGHSAPLTKTARIEVWKDASSSASGQQSTQSQTQPIVVTVQPAKSGLGSGSVRTALEIVLLVLVCLLIVIGAVVGFTRLRSDE